MSSRNPAEITRAAIPDPLIRTYDDVVYALYGGHPPHKRIRMDVCTMCVESFDKLVNIIAMSSYCIADIMQISHDGSCKAKHRRDCAACIRSHVYKMILNRNKEEHES